VEAVQSTGSGNTGKTNTDRHNHYFCRGNSHQNSQTRSQGLDERCEDAKGHDDECTCQVDVIRHIGGSIRSYEVTLDKLVEELGKEQVALSETEKKRFKELINCKITTCRATIATQEL